jgi:hypothetical protein
MVEWNEDEASSHVLVGGEEKARVMPEGEGR